MYTFMRAFQWINTMCDTTSAHLLVILVDVAVSKLLPTQFTFVWFVLAVDDLMSRHLVQTLKRTTADLTRVRPLLCSVDDQERCSLVNHIDVGRKMNKFLMQSFLTRVCDHVAFELIGGDELLVTCVAVKYFMYLWKGKIFRFAYHCKHSLTVEGSQSAAGQQNHVPSL